jgi:multifunctional beta-oxidation protein
MAELRYDGQVVVVTGAGSGLGRKYAEFFASRGAKVVVNDLGGSVQGAGSSAKAADAVVDAIRAAGGIAVANYDSVEHGDRIITQAISSFSRIDILINNAGVLRDITLKNMKDADWDVIMAVHVTGAYRTTRAAWPHFRKQKFGRVINTSSSSGLYGNFGQSNYAAAKLALVGFTETIAKEGAKYNILSNVIAPAAASRMTETVWPPEMMEAFSPEYVVPLVAVLTHQSSSENGSLFEAAAGHFSKIRWQRSVGLTLKPDNGLTPDVLLGRWNDVISFPASLDANKRSSPLDRLKEADSLPANQPGKPLDFSGKVVLVTGGGAGLGRAYATLFGKLGAKVVVNDIKGAEVVAKSIIDAGGQATAITITAEEGEFIVKEVIKAYGRIDIVVNNAGILRDKAFQNVSPWEVMVI